MDNILDVRNGRSRKWLVNLPTIAFIIVIVASLILGAFASVRAAQNVSTSTTGQLENVYVEVVVSGNTTYTSTVTCITPRTEVVVQPLVIVNSNQTVSTTTTYTTTMC